MCIRPPVLPIDFGVALSTPTALRAHVADLLHWRKAHATFDDVVEGLPAEAYGQVPDGLPYSLWQLLEHLRRSQRDILDYCREPGYTAGDWPDDYWPDAAAPDTQMAWADSVIAFRRDLSAMVALVENTDIDLLAEIPHASHGHTFLREALLVADHNAYHVGQMIAVRRLLGLWEEG